MLFQNDNLRFMKFLIDELGKAINYIKNNGIKTVLESLKEKVGSIRKTISENGFKNSLKSLFTKEVSKEQLDKYSEAEKVISDFWREMNNNGRDKNAAAEATQSLANMNGEIKKLIINSKSEAAARNSVARALRTQTAAQTALNSAINAVKATVGVAATIALNVAVALAISCAINGIISLIDKLVNARKNAEEEAKKSREEALENLRAYEEQIKSLDDITKSYNDAMASGKSFSEQQKDLKSVQEELTDSFQDSTNKVKEQADAIDLVNQGYLEAIENLKELRYEQAKQTVADNQTKYDEAKKALQEGHMLQVENPDAPSGYEIVTPADNATNIVASGAWGWNSKENSRGQTLEDYFSENGINERQIAITGGQSGSNTITVGGTLEEQLDTIEKMRSLYRSFSQDIDEDDDVREKRLENFDKAITDLRKKINEYKEIISSYEEAERIVNTHESYENLFSDTSDAGKEWGEKISDLQELNTKFQQSENTAEKSAYSIEINQLHSELENMARGNTEAEEILADAWEPIFDNIKQFENEFTSTSNAIREEFNNIIDNTYKSANENIASLDSFIEKIKNGEALSSEDILSISQVDASLLDKIVATTDGYVITVDNLTKSKNLLTEATKKEMETTIANTKAIVEELKVKKSQAEADLAAAQARVDSLQKASLYDEDANELYQKALQELPVTKTSVEQYGKLIDEHENHIKVMSLLINGIGKTSEAVGEAADELESAEEVVSSLTGDDLFDLATSRVDSIISEIDDEIAKLEEQKDSKQNEITEIENQRKKDEEWYDNEIAKLKEINEEQERSNELEEARQELEKARNQKSLRIWKAGVGWTWEVDTEAVKEAEEKLNDLEKENAINDLEKEKDEKLAVYDDEIEAIESYIKKEYDAQIDALNNEKNYWSDARQAYQDHVDAIKLTQDQELANEIGLTLSLRDEKEKQAQIYAEWQKMYDNAIAIKDIDTQALYKNVPKGIDIGASFANNVPANFRRNLTDDVKSFLTSNTTNNGTTNMINIAKVVADNPVDFMNKMQTYIKNAAVKSIIR